MREMNVAEMHEVNAGKTYACPFGCRKTGGYWSVYWHCLSSGCFKRNRYFNFLWKAGWGCIDAGLQSGICRAINCSTVRGKHFR